MSDIANAEVEKTAIGASDADGTTRVKDSVQAEATQLAAGVDCPVCHTSNPPSETYCIDCGFLLSSQPAGVADMPEAAPAGRLVTLDGIREFALRQGENTIGRENADILVSHSTVSRSHARITVRGALASIEDLESTNGTYVDGRRLGEGESIDLTDGSEIVVGNVSLRFQASEPAAPDEEEKHLQESEAPDATDPEGQPEPEPESEEAPPVAGRLVSVDGELSFDLFEGANTVGRRQADNALFIPDPYASGRHAEISAQSGVFTVTDVGSTNGTLVNGVRLEPNVPREVRPGDEITIGQSLFRLEEA